VAKCETSNNGVFPRMSHISTGELLRRQQQREQSASTQFLTGPDVYGRYKISKMTLWRWLTDSKLKFPQPALRINGRRYWRENDLVAWERSGAQ
jgi:predicted DNA-binding transcriptional regulator AlpA